jgi:hypothetical protein
LAEGGTPEVAAEVVKQVINFTPEALKRPPELRSNN